MNGEFLALKRYYLNPKTKPSPQYFRNHLLISTGICFFYILKSTKLCSNYIPDQRFSDDHSVKHTTDSTEELLFSLFFHLQSC